jgi:chloramphenicol-sensitive protein RarD
LVNVLLGAALFGERLRRMQWIAVALAAVGVLSLTLGYGAFPWIGIVLCGSFALYGVLRKVSRADSLPGLFLESAAVAPFALGYIAYLAIAGVSSFSPTFPAQSLLLAGGGVVTALPLLWFAHAARTIPLSTLGLIQYLSPTLTFLIGTLLYDEPFTRAHLFTFVCIWLGLALFTADARWQAAKRLRMPK